MIFVLLLLLQVSAPDAAQFVGAPKGTPMSGPALETETVAVSHLLRCPVCQGLSVADSPAPMAQSMKGQVRELLQRGYTRDQILLYFERSYGEFVLLRPKMEGVNVLVWILPLAGLLIGAGLVLAKLNRLEKAPVKPAQPASEDPYIQRVREMVDQ